MQTQSFSISKPSEINTVLRNTYLLLGMTTLFSGIMASVSVAFNLPFLAGLVCSLIALGLLFVINKTANSPSAIVWTFLFTGLLGLSLGPLLNYALAMSNGGSMVMQALGGTALVFFGLSAYVLLTKKDFSFIGGFLMIGLLVAIVAMVANIFFQIPALHLAINAAIVFIMSGFILYDTSRIVNGGERNYVLATVSIYLNLHNLFSSMLQLIMAFNDD